MVTFDRTAFIAKFQEEADEHLARLNEGIIQLESDPHNAELLDELFRVAHTLKGASKMVGILDVSEVSHKLEDMLAAMRAGRIEAGDDVSDMFFEALDALVFLADAASSDQKHDFDVEGLCGRLAEVAARGRTEEGRDPAAAETRAALSKRKAEPKKPMPKKAKPTKADSKPEEASEKESAEENEPAATEGQALPGLSGKKAAMAATIRVKTAQVDKLLNLVGEMVIGQIKSEQRLDDLKGLLVAAADMADQWGDMRGGLAEIAQAAGPRGDELRLRVARIDESTDRMRRKAKEAVSSYADDTMRGSTVVRELQEEGMHLRMLPVATIFDAFPRAVRDMAKDFNKKISLNIVGADTQLDKKVLEEINDPLIHIVRNSIDHGIEPPEEREAAGKPSEGTIELAASQEGDHIVVTVTDDGRGIDPARIRSAAVNRGMLTTTEAESLTDREAVFLVFETGFSTSQIITEMSGRGIGMDVVKEFIVEKLKGSVNIESRLGEGTQIILTLPLTLAIIRALLVRCSSQTFALPTTAVEETLTMSAEDVCKTQGREAVRLRRRTVPLVRLDRILGLPSKDGDHARKLQVVVVGLSGQRMGLVVDELAGEQQIVIKSLGSHLKRVPNVAGATILGAGEIVIILLVPDLMSAARTVMSSAVRQEGGEGEISRGPGRILIVEDSFTTRELERSIFEAAGYMVETAVDGMDALDQLEHAQFDLIVTDVQMPRLNGFELTATVKRDQRFAHIPVVIVTSLEREEEKRKGIEVGADAYVTKSVFNQDTLLEIVERLSR